MSRISIDVTPQQHKRLKAMAALQGKSIKEFVLASTLGAEQPSQEEADLAALEALLDDRIARAKTEGYSKESAEEIAKRVLDRADRGSDE